MRAEPIVLPVTPRLDVAQLARGLRVLAQLAHEVHSSLIDAATDLELAAAEAEDQPDHELDVLSTRADAAPGDADDTSPW